MHSVGDATMSDGEGLDDVLRYVIAEKIVHMGHGV